MTFKLDPEAARQIRTLLKTRAPNIVEMAREIGADPATFFEGEDWSGLDLRPCDLFGVSFRNSNLDGVIVYKDQAKMIKATKPRSMAGMTVHSRGMRMGAKIFISYSRDDLVLMQRLRQHLGGLKHRAFICSFDDTQILAGTDWDDRIKLELESADILLFLVSPGLLSSEYINKVEVKQAIDRHKADEVVVMPIALRPCLWRGTPFEGLQGLPSGLKPVAQWEDIDEAFNEIAESIYEVLNPNDDQSNGKLLQSITSTAKVHLTCEGIWTVVDYNMHIYFDGKIVGRGSSINGFNIDIETNPGTHKIRMKIENSVISLVSNFARSLQEETNSIDLELEKGKYDVRMGISRFSQSLIMKSIEKIS